MLIKAQPHDVSAYCDSAYSLALDQTKSCYPAYSDGIKTKADFMTAVRKNIEEDWNYSFFFEHYTPFPEPKYIARITEENFNDFRILYNTENEAYWNCDRILEKLSNWILYVYYQEHTPAGALALRGDNGYYEIYGIEFAENKYQEETCRALLTAALNQCKRIGTEYMTFFCEDAHQKLAQELSRQHLRTS